MQIISYAAFSRSRRLLHSATSCIFHGLMHNGFMDSDLESGAVAKWKSDVAGKPESQKRMGKNTLLFTLINYNY
jgi:hypothetical protein